MSRHLAANPALVDLWETFSGENRGSPAPYLDGTTVVDATGAVAT